MKILVINTGSSSIKYQLFDMSEREVLAAGLLERIGEAGSRLVHKSRGDDGLFEEQVEEATVADHRQGMKRIAAVLDDSPFLENARSLQGIGHRVVHGGEEFREPTLIDDHVLSVVRKQFPLAPLHNPANVIGIEEARAEFAGVRQVAVFDTAFHHTLPPQAFHYAVPRTLYERFHVRRYGFHGTSHAFVVKGAAELLNRPLSELNLVSLHLGNGASAAAVSGGKCIDTSMGMTPLEGLVMGTRCGDIDPALIFYFADELGMSIDEIDTMLNKDSGMKGVCGVNDMREVLARAASGDERAQLAVDIYTYRIKKYIGAYAVALGRLDGLIFTAGIGENSAEIRRRSCHGLEQIGIEIDAEKNEAGGSGPREIQSPSSNVKVLVVPTNEELEIAEQTVACLTASA